MLASSRLLESFIVLGVLDATLKAWYPPPPLSEEPEEFTDGGRSSKTKGKERASTVPPQPTPHHRGCTEPSSSLPSFLPTQIEPQRPLPFFISPIQKPSTHPLYGELDPSSDFPKDLVQLVGRLEVLTVEVFVRPRKGKGREDGWRVLKSWEIDLDRLKRWDRKVRFFP